MNGKPQLLIAGVAAVICHRISFIASVFINY